MLCTDSAFRLVGAGLFIRVRAGTVVTFVNSGALPHTIASKNALWTTGTLKEAQTGYVRFEHVGTFTYACEEHPWAMGQVFVDPQGFLQEAQVC